MVNSGPHWKRREFHEYLRHLVGVRNFNIDTLKVPWREEEWVFDLAVNFRYFFLWFMERVLQKNYFDSGRVLTEAVGLALLETRELAGYSVKDPEFDQVKELGRAGRIGGLDSPEGKKATREWAKILATWTASKFISYIAWTLHEGVARHAAWQIEKGRSPEVAARASRQALELQGLSDDEFREKIDALLASEHASVA